MADALKTGYEIKSVVAIDAAESKLIWSNDASQTIITLQKGANVIVCVWATANWANAVRITSPIPTFAKPRPNRPSDNRGAAGAAYC